MFFLFIFNRKTCHLGINQVKCGYLSNNLRDFYQASKAFKRLLCCCIQATLSPGFYALCSLTGCCPVEFPSNLLLIVTFTFSQLTFCILANKSRHTVLIIAGTKNYASLAWSRQDVIFFLVQRKKPEKSITLCEL